MWASSLACPVASHSLADSLKIHKEHSADTDIADGLLTGGPALPIQMEVEQGAGGTPAMSFDEESELQCGQKACAPCVHAGIWITCISIARAA